MKDGDFPQLCKKLPEGKSHKIPFNHHFPMVFLGFSCGFPMVFLWFSYGFPMVSYGFSMVFPSPKARNGANVPPGASGSNFPPSPGRSLATHAATPGGGLSHRRGREITYEKIHTSNMYMYTIDGNIYKVGPSSLAKLVQITPISLWFMVCK